MTFRKRTTRRKTLLQKRFPSGPPFRKLPYVCGVDMGQLEVGLAAHKALVRQHYRSSLRGVRERFSCRKEPSGLPAEQKKRSNR